MQPPSFESASTSSDPTVSDGEPRPRDVFESEILPLLFGSAGPEVAPALVLLNDTAGSGRSRFTSTVARQHPGIVVLSDQDLRGWARSSSAAAADQGGWLQRCIVYGLRNRRSILLEGSTFSKASLGAAAAFASSGFSTRVVVAGVRPAEALLADTSRYGQASPGMRRALSDIPRAARNARELVDALKEDASIGRLTILSRDGDVEFDEWANDGGFSSASSGLEAALSRRLTSLQAAQWLSELRRVTEFSESMRERPRELTERLIALHDVAVQEIIPELGVPAGSGVAALQEQRSAAALASLRRTLRPQSPREDLAAPVISVQSELDHGLSR